MELCKKNSDAVKDVFMKDPNVVERWYGQDGTNASDSYTILNALKFLQWHN